MAEDNKLREYIFIVDDSPEMVDLIYQDIEDLGCPIERFTLPREAIAMCESKHPFLVISDCSMPEINGIELCQAIRTILPSTHFVFYSGVVDSDTVLKSFGFGETSFFSKPYDVDQFIGYIKEKIAGRLKAVEQENEELSILRKTFVEETREYLAVINDGMLHIEKNGFDRETINGIFRRLHSIKGAAGGIGLTDIRKLAHIGEEVFDGFRTEKIQPTTENIQPLFTMCTVLEELVVDIEMDRAQGQRDDIITPVLDALTAVLDGSAASAGGVQKATYEFCLSQSAMQANTFMIEAFVSKAFALLNQGVDISLGDNNALEDFHKHCHALLQEISPFIKKKESAQVPKSAEAPLRAAEQKGAPPPPATSGSKTEAKKDGGDSTLRISEEKLNRYIHSTGELIIARNFLVHAVAQLKGSEKHIDVIKNAAENINHVAEELQSSALSMRAIPVKNIFQRLPRIVRDLAHSLSKKIDICTSGDEIEIDKRIGEAFSDALVHMVRNSVDHGIESPQVRQSAGKTPGGLIEIKARHEGNSIFIDVCDDGAGIDTDRLKSKAVEKGLISAAAAAALGQKEAMQLIFLPGFSTAAKITDVSGRGVGMDVVMTAIKDLGGEVAIDSAKGRGCTISVSLPIPSTLMVTRVIPISVSGTFYGLPAEIVQETVRIPQGRLSSLCGCQGFTLRNQVMPVIPLARLLNQVTTIRQLDRDDLVSIAIVQSNGQKCGVIVDTFGVIQELVVKKLPGMFAHINGLGGVSISNEGEIMLLLDVGALMSAMSPPRQTAESELSLNAS